MISDLHNIGAFAQEHHRKQITIEGGGYSIIGWTIPPSFVKTGNGSYTAYFTFSKKLKFIYCC